LDYNARPSSSSAAISGCHTSHITISRCALFLAQRRNIFLCLRQPLDWYRRNIYCKSIVLQMVLQIVSFFAILQGKTWKNSILPLFGAI
jgi:hypothetical protein